MINKSYVVVSGGIIVYCSSNFNKAKRVKEAICDKGSNSEVRIDYV
jgi:hypothetical protein